MKSTGVVRKLDELGRVVIPAELRRTLGLVEKDPIEIFVDEDRIILQKYQPNVEKEEVRQGLKQIAQNSTSGFQQDILERAMKLIK